MKVPGTGKKNIQMDIGDEKMKISIVIPALNEEKGIGHTVQAIPRGELQKMGYDVELIVVDNGSTDNTSKIAADAGARVILEPKRGYGSAYKTGFANAKGDYIVTSDGDLSYPVQDIPMLVDMARKENLGFITTNRFADIDKDAMSIQNKIGNGILNIAMRVLFNANIIDSQSGMWVIKKEVLDRLILRSDGMPLSEEIKLEACFYGKCTWKEVPIKYKARVGKVKLRVWRDGIQNLLYLIKKRIKR